MKNERIIIHKVGPIKQVEIDLANCLVFIGPQSSGKSVISKLISICRSVDLLINDEDIFLHLAEEQNIGHFIHEDSIIEYKSDAYSISYINNECEIKSEYNTSKIHDLLVNQNETNEYSEKKLAKVNSIIDSMDAVIKKIEKLEVNDPVRTELFSNFNILTNESKAIFEEIEPHIRDTEKVLEELDKLVNESLYIPAERQIIPLITQSALSLINNKVPLELFPKYILNFGEKFEEATVKINKFEIPFLQITYAKIEGKEFVLTNGQNPISLSSSSSGIQSLIPTLLVVEDSYSLLNKGHTFIIEEPELNLYPKTQKDLIYHLVDRCTRKDENHYNELVITTHSPYVLAAFNNLLLAGKANKKITNDVAKIIPKSSWLKQEQFNAYFVMDGECKSIFNAETGLIEEEELDAASYEIMNEFDSTFNLIKNA